MGETEDISFRWRYVMSLQLIHFARWAKDTSEIPEWEKDITQNQKSGCAFTSYSDNVNVG